MDRQDKIEQIGKATRMIQTSNNSNEVSAKKAFSTQAPVFDEIYGNDTIVNYKRARVREHILTYLPRHANILELNAGTGEDAIYFARSGHRVHATDISETMQEILKKKVVDQGLQMSVGNECCSFTCLHELTNCGPFDLAFSNFAGLNCTNQLPGVLMSLDKLVKPGGIITLVLLPKFCLWEFLLLFRGRFRTAMRRFAGRNGTRAHIEGEYFRCWYYDPSFLRRYLEPKFELIELEGLCTIVPPSYITNFAEKHPRLYKFLLNKEEKYKNVWPWKLIGDYYIASFRKRP